MNLLDLMVKVGLDDQASGGISDLSSKMTGTLGSAAKVAAGAVAAGAAAAGAGVVALGKEALESYAQFEQLEGGIGKLFGTGGKNLQEYASSMGQSIEEAAGKYDALSQASDLVMQNAQKAYATAGMSANEYMEQVSGFSAALVNSLGGDTVAAAERADVAMRAISDNVNTFGTDAQSVSYAFQGFAKQNYTMLDNLKLGYGGTKSEMERLIADANEWGAANGKASDLSIDSFADVVTAIDQIQQKQQIAGTTAREAAKTIEGSVNATKAAWANLLTEFGKEDGDIGARIGELAESAGNVVDNVVPRIAQIGEGIAAALPEILPKAIELGAQVMASIREGLFASLPAVGESLLNVGAGIIESVTDALANLPLHIRAFFVSTLPNAFSGEGMGDTFAQIGESLASFFLELGPTLMASATELFEGLRGFFAEQFATLFPEEEGGFGEAIAQLFESISTAINENVPLLLELVGGAVESVITFIGDNLPMLLEIVSQLVSSVVDFVMTNAPALVDVVGDVLTTLIDTVLGMVPQIIEVVVGLVDNLVTAVAENAPALFDAALGFFNQMLDALVQNLPGIISGLIDGLMSLIDTVIQNAPGFLQAAGEFVLGLLVSIVQHLPEILAALANGLLDLINSVADKLPDMLKAGGEMIGGLITAIAEALPDLLKGIGDLVQDGIDHVGDFVGDMLEAGGNLIQGLIDGIAGAIGGVGEAIMGGLGGAVEEAKAFLGIASPSKLFREFGGFTMEGFAEGIDDMAGRAEKAMSKAAESVYRAASGEVEIFPNALAVSPAQAVSGGTMGASGIVINLNYNAGADANQMLRDVYTGIVQYRAAGVI